MADRPAEPCGAGRRARIAAQRLLGRSRAARARARNGARPRRPVTGGLARVGGRWAVAAGGAESSRRVGAHGCDAVRPWPSLFALADYAPAARDLVHAD